MVKKKALASKKNKTSRNSKKKSAGAKTSLKGSHKKVKSSRAQIEATKKAKINRRQVKTAEEHLNREQGKVGRPSILTSGLIVKVSKLILVGMYVETACASVGLPKGLYYEWLKLGAKRKTASKEDKELIDPIYEQFTDAIEKAMCDAEVRDLMRIDEAAGRSWQAAAWKLERKYPTRWSRNQKVEHSGKIETGPSAETIEDTRRRMLRILKDPEAMAAAEKLLEIMEGGDGED